MDEPSIIVPIVLAAFLVAGTTSFALLEGRRALLWTMFGGWLFLPQFNDRFKLPVLDSKGAVIGATLLVGSFLFDTGSWRAFRPRWLDLPMAIFCLWPFGTAIHNDLGSYEATAATLASALTWGAPYLLGRVYLGRSGALRETAEALVVAALVYVPLCAWEIRMSPQLHSTFYGFRQFRFDQAYRWGGYRPSVFMQHGIMVGLFMASSTLVAFWLWRTGSRKRIMRLPLGWATVLLGVTTVLCKSTGALILLAVGLAVLEGTRVLRTPALIVALALVPWVYSSARLSGWEAVAIVDMSRDWIDADRSNSIEFRIHNEDLLIKRAMMRPWMGWGRFGRSFSLVNEEGETERAVTDGWWIIVLGVRGIVGLVAMGALLALPPLAVLRTYPARLWADPRLAPAAALALVLLLWAVDALLNAMPAPVHPAIAGALVTCARTARVPRRFHRRRGAPTARGLMVQRSPGT
jgi:hypothetical protein